MQPSSPKPKKNSERTGKFFIVMGTNGTGKTTTIKDFVAAELRKPGGRVLILTPDASEFINVPEVSADFPERLQRYSGARKILTTKSNAASTLQLIYDHYREGLLVFDDCRAYFKAATLDILETVLVRRRMMMVDIIAVGHGPNKIPPAFFAYATHFVLFKTTVPMRCRKDELDNIEYWETVQQNINQKANSDPHYKEIHSL
jgi:energy-coupling factor transporter ATP-binding protein EcfA2